MNILTMKISVTSLIPIITFLIQKTESRNQGCSLLILVDDSLMSLVQNDESRLRLKLDKYVMELNDIYQTTILINVIELLQVFVQLVSESALIILD